MINQIELSWQQFVKVIPANPNSYVHRFDDVLICSELCTVIYQCSNQGYFQFMEVLSSDRIEYRSPWQPATRNCRVNFSAIDLFQRKNEPCNLLKHLKSFHFALINSIKKLKKFNSFYWLLRLRRSSRVHRVTANAKGVCSEVEKWQ